MQSTPSAGSGGKIPQHLAIIMDGNGRWAKARGLSRNEGHRRGVRVVDEIVEECRRKGVRYLTLFSFSTENWNRSEFEVRGLMTLFREFLDLKLSSLLSAGIRLRAIGDLDRLPFAVRKSLRKDIEETKHNTEMDLILAISYGGREEIIAATRNLASEVEKGKLKSSDINRQLFEKYLWTSEVPDPDLLIRSSGEMRISNFLLWQLAYSEIIVSDLCWPEFSREELARCFKEYASRERRFGLTSEQIQVTQSGPVDCKISKSG